MSEIMRSQVNLVINNIILIVNTFAGTICITYFFNKLFYRVRITCLLLPAGYCLSSLLLKSGFIEVPFFIGQLIPMVVVLLCSLPGYEGSFGLRSYGIITVFALRILVQYLEVFITRPIWQMVQGILLEGEKRNQGIEFYAIVTGLMLILVYMFRFMLLFFSLYLVAKQFRQKKNRFSLKEALYLITPSMMGYLNGLLLAKFIDIFGTETGNYFLDAYPYFYFLIFLDCLVSIAGILIAMVLFQNMLQKKEEEKQRYMIENQIRQVKNHITEIERADDGIRGLKHDMKNYTANIESLAAQKKYKELEAYIGGMKETISQSEYIYQTGNPIMDIIINEKYFAAAKQGISCQVHFTFPANCNINAFDLSIILNNAFDNAIEACTVGKVHDIGQEPVMMLTSRRKKNTYIIEIKNTYYQDLKWDNTTNLPLTSKTDTGMHGMGLKNVQAIAKKYYGDIDIEIKDKQFVLTIMLLTEG